MSLADKREEILSLLRHMAQRPLEDEAGVWHQIQAATALTPPTQSDGKFKQQIDDCVYALALVYARHVGAMPAFSNGDRPTRFEQFVNAVPMPPEFRITPNRIKASIRKLDAKHNSTFARDLQSMGSSFPSRAPGVKRQEGTSASGGPASRNAS
jgi:hypothetical protein